MTVNWNNDGFNATDQGDSFAFRLLGGQYGATVTADDYGAHGVTYQALSASGAYVDVLTAFTAAGFATIALPAGQFRVLLDFDDASTSEADAATALTDAGTALVDIEGIADVPAESLALGQALLDAVQAVVDAIAAKLPATAALAVTAAQAASAAAQADATISGDATSMTALGTVDTDLTTLAADVAAAPTGVAASLGATPMRRH